MKIIKKSMQNMYNEITSIRNVVVSHYEEDFYRGKERPEVVANISKISVKSRIIMRDEKIPSPLRWCQLKEQLDAARVASKEFKQLTQAV